MPKTSLTRWQHELQPLAVMGGTLTFLTPIGQSLEPRDQFPFVISSSFYSPCNDLAFLAAICWILMCRETQNMTHTPGKLLLESVRGQDLSGGRKQLLRWACFYHSSKTSSPNRCRSSSVGKIKPLIVLR